MEKKYTLQKILGLIAAVAIVILIAKCTLAGGLPGRFQADNDYEASIVKFLDLHPELGKMKFPFVEEAADWAEGKRMWVYTNNGNYLVYFIETEIVSIYQETQRGQRIRIFNTYDAE